MINIERTSVMNMENAIRGARNPMNSWGRMDSEYDENGEYRLGPNDLKLAQTLCKSGSDHRKFLRQILVCTDITAPLYWWKEFDTYKVGTAANSTSTMHKIHAKPFEMADFSTERMTPEALACMEGIIVQLEALRQEFIGTKDKDTWYSIIQLLPSGYHQMRTCTMSYENLVNMYHARRSHKLTEWREYCQWIAQLPYGKELIIMEEDKL